jgi:dienelactone hydrolase
LDNWLVDAAYRNLGTNFLLPDVIDTLLEFDFNHADIQFVERNAFNVKAIPATWARLSVSLQGLVDEAEQENRFHSAFMLRQRLVHSLIRSWTLSQEYEDAKKIWEKINSEFDKATAYLEEHKKIVFKRVIFKVGGAECYGLLRIPTDLPKEKLNVLITLPGMDMTKEYFPSLTGSHTDFRGFATLSLDLPGHGFSYVNGLRLSAKNIDELMQQVVNWLNDDSSHDFTVKKIGILGIGTGANYALRAGMKIDSLTVVAGFEGGFLFRVEDVLAEQSSMRLKKLTKMINCKKDEVLQNLVELSIESLTDKLEIPVILTVGEYDDLFPNNHVSDLLSYLESDFSINLYEDEGHVLGKVVSESMMITLDQIEECFQGNSSNLKGIQIKKKRN